jgi:hypothetical protein
MYDSVANALPEITDERKKKQQMSAKWQKKKGWRNQLAVNASLP